MINDIIEALVNQAGRTRPVQVAGGYFPIRVSTSPSPGKRPVACFEKTSFPSTSTSKIPPPTSIISAWTPSSFFNSSAKLAARG